MQQYTIAGLTISVSGEGLGHIPGFSVFSVSGANEQSSLTIELGKTLSNWDAQPIYSFDFEDVPCDFTEQNGVYFYRMMPQGSNPLLLEIHPEKDNFYALTNMNEETPSYWLRFAVWMAFGIYTVYNQTVAIHASTIMYQDKSILCLGESGTGKSTHTRLWQNHIQDTELLNDDSPFIYAGNQGSIVFGSPWSGKTPCYKNKQTPIAAIVRISQAPYNKISRLSNLSALGAILPSCPPAFAYDENLSDRMCEIISSLLQQVPVYSLECLPDADAAHLVYTTLKNEDRI